MTALFVVENLYVFENCRRCMDSRNEGLMENKFCFQRGKETFGYGIVPTVSSSTHALNAVILCEFASKYVAGVLAATIRVSHDGGMPSPVYTHPEGIQDDVRFHVCRH